MQERQTDIFDFEKFEVKHKDFKNSLLELNKIIDWKLFLPILNEALSKAKKSDAGRKPFDRILMFKIIILQTQYNLSDDQTEYQIYDRYSFREFLELRIGDKIPDAKTIWLFKEQLAQQGVVEKLFTQFGEQLNKQGYRAQKGQIIDASIIPVPKQRNSREENAQIKAGEIPESWQEQPNKLEQKDTDARWTKKNDVSYYGYKNHVDADVKHKLIRDYEVTDAAVHDSQVVDEIIDPNNSNADVYADSAYRSAAQEEKFVEDGYRSKVHHKGKRNKPLSEFKQAVNTNRSKVRAKVEHIFGNQMMLMGGKLMRCIGMVRAKACIGLRNLVYNMHRFAFLSKQKSKLA
jgi:transposase, IS5 family